MSKSLPLRANLEWLKKVAKEHLKQLRLQNPNAQLSDAQFDVALEYGFSSWRELKGQVDQIAAATEQFNKLQTALASAPVETIHPDDPDLVQVMSVIRMGNQKALEELLKRRPRLAQARDVHGQAPLHLAAEHNDPVMGVTLLLFGADPQAKFGQSGHTVLSWAVTCNALEFAQTMVRAGIKADLFSAAGMGSLEAVKVCFDESGSLIPNAVHTGSTRFQDGTILPCPPDSISEKIADALYMACRNGHVEVVRFLLAKNPNLSFRAYEGGTLLHWAYFGSSNEVIELILQAGLDPLAKDDTLKVTPRAFGICIPANWGIPELVIRQLKRDPTLIHLQGEVTTALHEAARQGHLSIVQLLLASGADRAIKNADDKTAGELAKEKGHSHIVELLRR